MVNIELTDVVQIDMSTGLTSQAMNIVEPGEKNCIQEFAQTTLAKKHVTLEIILQHIL